jgi:hypothetical protein
VKDERKSDRWTPAAIVIVALGMLLGAPSLAYPYGRDQGLFHYIGREWFVHGAVPYRDTFDLKPPPIYFVYGICARVFGDAMWGIRLVEWLLLIPLCGFLAASLSMPKDEPTPKMRIALGVLSANVLYFGYFDFWNSGQCEIWCATACLLAVWCILRTKLSIHRAAALSGVCAGFAFLMKPPAAPMVLVIVGTLLAKHRIHRKEDRKKALLALASFGGAAIGVGLVTLLYFVKVGAFTELVDVLVNYNREYVKHDRDGNDFSDFVTRVFGDHHHFDPWSTVVHFFVVLGAARGGIDGKDREARSRWLLAAAFLASAALGVFVQAKFYHYHYGLLVSGEVLGAVLVLGDLGRIITSARARRFLVPAAPLLVWVLSAPHCRRHVETAFWTARYVFAGESRDWFTDKFRAPGIHYYFKDREQIGVWVREHSNPDDRLLVRAFEPTIYVSAHRSYGGRFATTHHLNSHKVLYRRAEWRAEDRRDIERIKPRFIVAMRPRPDMAGWPDPEEIDDATYFAQFGYRQVHAEYQFVVMERSP